MHAGMVEIFFGDGSTHLLGPGGLARVDASTHRGLRNAGDSDAVILVAGGRGGYVGRDGRLAEGSTRAGTGMPVRAGTGIPESGAGGVGAQHLQRILAGQQRAGVPARDPAGQHLDVGLQPH